MEEKNSMEERTPTEEKKTMIVNWIEPGSRDSPGSSHLLHAVHPDPTAERAIGNVLREERKKKRRAAEKEARREKRRELALAGKMPVHERRRKKSHPRTLVWRAEDEAAEVEKAEEKTTVEGGGVDCVNP